MAARAAQWVASGFNAVQVLGRGGTYPAWRVGRFPRAAAGLYPPPAVAGRTAILGVAGEAQRGLGFGLQGVTGFKATRVELGIGNPFKMQHPG